MISFTHYSFLWLALKAQASEHIVLLWVLWRCVWQPASLSSSRSRPSHVHPLHVLGSVYIQPLHQPVAHVTAALCSPNAVSSAWFIPSSEVTSTIQPAALSCLSLNIWGLSPVTSFVGELTALHCVWHGGNYVPSLRENTVLQITSCVLRVRRLDWKGPQTCHLLSFLL